MFLLLSAWHCFWDAWWLPVCWNMQQFRFVDAVYFCSLCEDQIGCMKNWGVHCALIWFNLINKRPKALISCMWTTRMLNLNFKFALHTARSEVPILLQGKIFWIRGSWLTFMKMTQWWKKSVCHRTVLTDISFIIFQRLVLAFRHSRGISMRASLSVPERTGEVFLNCSSE